MVALQQPSTTREKSSVHVRAGGRDGRTDGRVNVYGCVPGCLLAGAPLVLVLVLAQNRTKLENITVFMKNIYYSVHIQS